MTHPQPVPTDNSGGMLERVHQLGSAAGTLFNRLYKSFVRRKELAVTSEQPEQAESRTRELRRALDEKSIEVERMQAILASISEGIIMQDTQGRIVMMNTAARDMLGSQRNFWTTDLGILFQQSRDIPTFNSELAPVGEALRTTVGDRILSAQIAAITDQSDTRIGTMMILSDVTEDTLAERLKNSLVTHISHELITPLAPMRIASEILANTPEDQPANRRMVEMIGRNVDILDRMVTEMLDMSAMTSGEFTIQRDTIDLEALLWDITNEFKETIHDAQLELTMMLRHPQDLTLAGDQKYLGWAIKNLVRNAIQYNEPGQRVLIAAGASDQRVFITIEDTGVGISEDDLPRIFDLFYRGEPRTRSGKRLDPRGLGQGLFVARTVAHAHGGQLTVDSEPQQGSRFEMTLPRNVPPALPA